MALQQDEDREFWRLPKVEQTTGLSKSELYRQIADGKFPKARAYKEHPRKRFWLSGDVRAWQRRQLAPVIPCDDLLG